MLSIRSAIIRMYDTIDTLVNDYKWLAYQSRTIKISGAKYLYPEKSSFTGLGYYHIACLKFLILYMISAGVNDEIKTIM